MNELLLIMSLLFIFSLVLLAYRLFGRSGLYMMSCISTVFANVEVIILVKAFGMEQTLGNVLFASTFLVTDILSECEGKKCANKAVWLGIFSQIFFLILSQSWLLYAPVEDNGVMSALKVVFSNTPRMIAASLAVYAVSQIFDVWLYHKWWKFTEKKFGDKRRFLWLRNNGSTLISQLINTFLFNLLAFAGTYNTKTLLSIIASSYLIYVVTSLLDTPAVYLARKISDRQKSKQSVSTVPCEVSNQDSPENNR